MKMLFGLGADVHARINSGHASVYTALHVAAARGHLKAVKVVVQHSRADREALNR